MMNAPQQSITMPALDHAALVDIHASSLAQPGPLESFTAQPRLDADVLPLVPAELKTKPNWVRWKLEIVNGRLSKVPYQLNGNKASSTDRATWNSYGNIISGAVINDHEGVGVMTDGTWIGFDLDGCRNPESGEIASWARRVVEALGTYTEITPSGMGVRAYALGTLPDGARRFSMAASAGFGDKVGIEAYSGQRYFTVTGNRIGDASSLDSPNVVQAYELCGAISREFPSQTRKTAPTFHSQDSSSVTYESAAGTVATSKLAVLMYGTITSRCPFVIEDAHGNKVTAPSQSEADMSLATLLAMKQNDAELIDAAFRESSLYRVKWERLGERTIEKAIKTAQRLESKTEQFTFAAGTNRTETESGESIADEDTVPEFDESVITGIYRDIVSLSVGGTTIPPQFAFLNAKIYFGARLAGKVTFEGLDCDSSYYGTAIGVTGTSKGESWRRTIEKILCPEFLNLRQQLKIIYSADSGAGLKDCFFEPPHDSPVVCYVDEVTSLGHKVGEKKSPEILDTIIELADSHRVSRVLAKKGKQGGSKTHDNAHLSLYACGQDGPAFMSAFAGRTKLGLFDRLYPEFSGPIEAGDLPEIAQADVLDLHKKIGALNFDAKMTMSDTTRIELSSFWNAQPVDIRRKIRFKKYLTLDMYMAAFGRGVTAAEPEDLATAIKIFNRQIAIRRVHFTGEVPDRVGYYIGHLKKHTESMRKRLVKGEAIAWVAMSLRDFQTQSNAFRDNEIHVFNQAWRNYHEAWLTKVLVTGANGHVYDKFMPVPREDETWAPLP
jgi:putative DNA primase/helicase